VQRSEARLRAWRRAVDPCRGRGSRAVADFGAVHAGACCGERHGDACSVLDAYRDADTHPYRDKDTDLDADSNPERDADEGGHRDGDCDNDACADADPRWPLDMLAEGAFSGDFS
jgi:hypothetical protein